MKIYWKTVMAWFGGILNLTACDGISIGTCMYATPYADYDVNIKICDEQGEAIPGIRVSSSGYYEGEEDPNAFYSDANGQAKATLTDSYSFGHFVLTDIDGESNGGQFETTEVNTSQLETKQTKKGKGWYEGRYDVTGTVKMKKKSSGSGE